MDDKKNYNYVDHVGQYNIYVYVYLIWIYSYFIKKKKKWIYSYDSQLSRQWFSTTGLRGLFGRLIIPSLWCCDLEIIMSHQPQPLDWNKYDDYYSYSRVLGACLCQFICFAIKIKLKKSLQLLCTF